MISATKLFGGSKAWVVGAAVTLNPDLARFQVFYPTADHDAILPSPTQLKHWRPGPMMFTLLNLGLFDVTVKDHTGATVVVMSHLGDEIAQLALRSLSPSSLAWSVRTRAL